MTNKKYIVSAVMMGVMFILGGLIFNLNKDVEPVLASIQDGQGYNGTTTMPGFKNNSVLSLQSGMLGSVVITGVGTLTGNIELYDATTTVAANRAPTMSTSSITVASINGTIAAGTYTFDRELKYGLVISVNPTGAVQTWPATAATTTITWK